jgi:hypothetical protein
MEESAVVTEGQLKSVVLNVVQISETLGYVGCGFIRWGRTNDSVLLIYNC